MAIVQTKENPTEKKIPSPTIKQAAILDKKDLVVRARYIRNTPDKLRFVGKILVGMNLVKAIEKLSFVPKAAATDIQLVLKNALSQAKDRNLDETNLYIKSLAVLEGPKLKRRRIVHRGRATSILKRMSHLTIVLNDKVMDKSSKSKANLKNTSGVKNGK